MNIRFQCLQCLSVMSGHTARITCPISSVIETYTLWYSQTRCLALISVSRNQINRKTNCNNSSTCSIETVRRYERIVSVYYQCKDDNNNPDTIRTESNDRSSISGEDTNTEYPVISSISDGDTNTEYPGGPNYAAIGGGIIGGVLLIICIIVGVFLLRRRNCTESSKEQVITSLNPSYDPTHVQAQAETYQQGHLMNSAETSHVSTSHAIHVDNTTNEESNTYSHIQNAVDDSDVMYDHTIRHNVHDTCDGDYGIAQRRITEDDYDVSGNYHRSPSKEADPVYN